MIMKYAPIGVFALIAVTVANFGFASLLPLAKLVILVYVAILFFAFVILGLIARLFGFSVIKLMRIFKDELVLAYSTASSETVLPRVIEKMEAYGAPKAICSFVVPTGYSFNLDGSTCTRASRQSSLLSCMASTCVTHMIMKYAPIGVFALIAVTVANFGFASLLPLA
ncbi:cation:dicarboxylate symporter family transporter, partial [Corynebacterium diphtheriae]